MNTASEYTAPPSRETVIATLRAHEADIRALGVSGLFLFGSVARGDAKPGSDIDLLCEVANPKFGLIALGSAQDAIAELLKSKVDLTTRGSLNVRMRPRIEATAVKVF